MHKGGHRQVPPVKRSDATAGTAAVVDAQNALTDSVLARCGTRDAFKDLFTELFNYERFGTPYKRGERCVGGWREKEGRGGRGQMAGGEGGGWRHLQYEDKVVPPSLHHALPGSRGGAGPASLSPPLLSPLPCVLLPTSMQVVLLLQQRPAGTECCVHADHTGRACHSAHRPKQALGGRHGGCSHSPGAGAGQQR